jgi:hypothetical protein
MKRKPKWNTMASLISWLEGYGRSRRYDYLDCQNCLGAQYCRYHGQPYFIPSTLNRGFRGKLEKVAAEGRETFGAALVRARSLAH